MKNRWIPILGAAAALIFVKIVKDYFGATISLVVLGALLLSWLGVFLIYRKQLAKIRTQLAGLDEKERAEILSRASPAIRKDLEQLAAKDKSLTTR